MQVGSLGSPAARVTWMWTSAALSYFCRSYTPLRLSQLSLVCCLISEPPLPLSHRHREKPGGKVCYLFSGHLPGSTGPSIPDPLASLCPPLTPFLHFSPMCCRGRNTYSSMSGTELLPWIQAGQIRCLSACQKQYSEQPTMYTMLYVQGTQGGISTLSLCFRLSPTPTGNVHHHLPTFHVAMSPNSLAFLGEPDCKSGDSIRTELLGKSAENNRWGGLCAFHNKKQSCVRN